MSTGPSTPRPSSTAPPTSTAIGCRSAHDPVPAIARVRTEGRGFVWIGLHEPDEDEMSVLADLFGLHELAVEDAVHAYQRPKMDRYDNSLFLVLKTVCYVEHTAGSASQIVQNGEIMMFLGPDFIVTVRHGAHSQLHRRPRRPGGRSRAAGDRPGGGDACDRRPDRRRVPVRRRGGRGRHRRDGELGLHPREVRSTSSRSTCSSGRSCGLRRAVSPLTPALRSLAGTPHRLVPAEIREYFRDVEDHLSVVAERVSTFDEMLTTLVSAALAEVTTRQNEDMRKISAWAAIALVPTAIAGIYGMNFEHMPELSWTYGYPMALGVIVDDVRDAVHAAAPARLAVTRSPAATPRIRSTSEFDTCPSPNCGRPSDAGDQSDPLGVPGFNRRHRACPA